VVTKVNGFEYVGAGNITSVSPSAGQGTTLVTIQGTKLLGGGSKATSVTLGGVPASITSDATNSTYLIVRANNGPIDAGSPQGDVVITSDVGVEITALNAFTYSILSSISPSSGQGGTKVTLEGTSLLADGGSVDKVELNGVEVDSVESATAAKLVVVAKAQAIGADQTGTARITLKNGQTIESVALTDGSLRKEFTYKIPGAITKVAPAAGQENTTVTITGSTLLGQGAKADSVTLAGVAATVVSNNNSMVVIKAGASGATAAGAVVITADTGAIVSKASTFGYVGVGNITSVTPESGQLGTKVTLVGTDLLAGGSSLSAASLAGIAVSKIEKETATEVVVVAARSEAAVTGDIVLSSANGRRQRRAMASSTLQSQYLRRSPRAMVSQARL
jgi:hypothetical protein